MKNLESGLTGNRRMKLFVDADALAKRIDEVRGIAGVRFWKVPLLAEGTGQAIAKAAERDPLLAFWYFSRWAILESQLANAEKLALGRWRHLHGQFDTDEEEDTEGARVLSVRSSAGI